MRKIVFLASANAKKPEIIINSFYSSINRIPSQDILLTDKSEGNLVEKAKELDMEIIVTPDPHFSDEDWISKNLKKISEYTLVSCGWPFKIPNSILYNFKVALNCHGSYLPDYRGSRAYMHYWANCSDFFGATIHYINEKFDDGNILVRAKQQMFSSESQDIVFVRTAELCGHLLVAAIEMSERNDPGFVPTGLKRYFFKLTPKEFEEHRLKNEKLILEGKEPCLTPHKVIE